MQWLIDIIKAWVQAQGYLTDGYVNRGDPAIIDFDMGDLIMDWGIHYLDLSAIVPEGVKAVHLFFYFISANAGTCMWLMSSDCVNCWSALGGTTQVAGIEYDKDGPVALGPDRRIKYSAGSPPITSVAILVRGWWF